MARYKTWPRPLSPAGACEAIREAHQGTDYGREALYNSLVEIMVTLRMISILSFGELRHSSSAQETTPTPYSPEPPDKAH